MSCPVLSPGSLSPYQAALEAALAERAGVEKELESARSRITELEEKREQLSLLIESIAAVLPDKLKAQLKHELKAYKNIGDEPKGGVVYNNVINLFKTSNNNKWSASDVIESLNAKGITAEKKQVYNILNYLERGSLLKRISRGRYLFMGSEIITGDDLDSTCYELGQDHDE